LISFFFLAIRLVSWKLFKVNDFFFEGADLFIQQKVICAFKKLVWNIFFFGYRFYVFPQPKSIFFFEMSSVSGK